MAMIVTHKKHGLCFYAGPIATPDAAWLSVQKKAPVSGEGWHQLFPLTGGSVRAQISTYGQPRIATEADYREALVGHGFNPAAAAIKAL